MASKSTITDISFTDDYPLTINHSAYIQFLEDVCTNVSMQQAIISFPFKCSDPLQWFNAINQRFGFRFYWEEPKENAAIAAVGITSEITGTGCERFAGILSSLANLRQTSHHIDLESGRKKDDTLLVGGFSFFDEIKEQEPWKGFEPASFILPEFALKKNGDQSRAYIAVSLDNKQTPQQLHQSITAKLHTFFSTTNGNGEASLAKTAQPVPRKIKPTPNAYSSWTTLVNNAKQAIDEDQFDKVVLGRLLQLQIKEHDPISTLQNLRLQYPKCSTFLVKWEASDYFIGSSPEQLLSTRNNVAKTEALAGSIARGTTKKEDKERGLQLLKSIKDHQEHQFVLDDIMQLLQPYVHSLQSASQPIIKKLANVQHLYSPIRGTIKENEDVLSILGSLHPTPAVGGTPREEALKYICQYESFNRGWFASPVGWVTTNGDAKFTVGIRSALIGKDTARLFAGCGIVSDSDAETEWQETNLKFMPMLSALNYD